jgi:hypothetical protein
MTRRPPTSIAAANRAARSTVLAKDEKSTADPRTGPSSSDNASHPARSSIIAEAMTKSPTSDLKRPRSSNVLAITGSAEMLRATPRNNAIVVRRDGSSRSESGKSSARMTPLANGSSMPRRPVSAALRPRRLRTPRSTSRPTTTSSRTTAIVEYPLIID